MPEAVSRRRTIRIGIPVLLGAGMLSGCAMVPRNRIAEAQRLTQSLRSENARLKSQVLSLQAQNRDYADRALDDLRRLTARQEAIDRLEQSVQAYQDDRDRLAAAYQRLAVSLGRTPETSALGMADTPPEPEGNHQPQPLASKEVDHNDRSPGWTRAEESHP